jgi:hypothetical protein
MVMFGKLQGIFGQDLKDEQDGLGQRLTAEG